MNKKIIYFFIAVIVAIVISVFVSEPYGLLVGGAILGVAGYYLLKSPIKILICILMLCFVSCKEEDLNPKHKFILQMTDFEITAKPLGYEHFTVGSELEVWCSGILNKEYPIPSAFYFLNERSQNFGEYISFFYTESYREKFNFVINPDNLTDRFIYFRIRLKNENGFSKWKVLGYKYGTGVIYNE